MSTVEVVGRVTALASAPILKGARSTIAANGADKRKNSQREVRETTLTPAILRSAQAMTTARATHHSAIPAGNHGNMRVRYATNRVG